MVNDLQFESFPSPKIFPYITFPCEKCKIAFTSGFVFLVAMGKEYMLRSLRGATLIQ